MQAIFVFSRKIQIVFLYPIYSIYGASFNFFKNIFRACYIYDIPTFLFDMSKNISKYRKNFLIIDNYYAIIYSLVVMEAFMALSYNKLWKLLIDKNLRKSDLHSLTGISQSTIAKLSNGENVNTDILEKICRALNCEIGDIVEIQEELK